MDLSQLGKREMRSSQHRTATTSELFTKTTQLTTFYPRFSHPGFDLVALQLPKIRPDKPKQSPEQPETHHNSPQTPKTRFIHNQVVGPFLLTTVLSEG
jgi:hypothetical protein